MADRHGHGPLGNPAAGHGRAIDAALVRQRPGGYREVSDPALRPAVVGDAADIHTLLLRHAAAIPLAVETLDQEEALYAAIRKILAFGQSWVALDGEAIVGAVLVDSAEVGRHWGENELLTLRYAAGEAVGVLLGKVLD